MRKRGGQTRRGNDVRKRGGQTRRGNDVRKRGGQTCTFEIVEFKTFRGFSGYFKQEFKAI